MSRSVGYVILFLLTKTNRCLQMCIKSSWLSLTTFTWASKKSLRRSVLRDWCAMPGHTGPRSPSGNWGSSIAFAHGLLKPPVSNEPGASPPTSPSCRSCSGGRRLFEHFRFSSNSGHIAARTDAVGQYGTLGKMFRPISGLESTRLPEQSWDFAFAFEITGQLRFSGITKLLCGHRNGRRIYYFVRRRQAFYTTKK